MKASAGGEFIYDPNSRVVTLSPDFQQQQICPEADYIPLIFEIASNVIGTSEKEFKVPVEAPVATE